MTGEAILAFLRRFWPAIPMLALVAALGVTRGTLAAVRDELRQERAGRAADAAAAKLAATEAELRWVRAGATATTDYADRLANRAPIILRSTDTVRTYAQTDAGRAVCLGADRVLGIDALDADLADDPTPAGRGDGAMPRDADAAPAGR